MVFSIFKCEKYLYTLIIFLSKIKAVYVNLAMEICRIVVAILHQDYLKEVAKMKLVIA